MKYSVVVSDPFPNLSFCSFCPLDQKFASCSDDGTVRIWDFLKCQEERILRGIFKNFPLYFVDCTIWAVSWNFFHRMCYLLSKLEFFLSSVSLNLALWKLVKFHFFSFWVLGNLVWQDKAIGSEDLCTKENSYLWQIFLLYFHSSMSSNNQISRAEYWPTQEIKEHVIYEIATWPY